VGEGVADEVSRVMKYLRQMLIAVVSAGVVSLFGAQHFANVSAQLRGTVRFTADDYLAIRQLVARYPHVLNTAANNGNDYADLFTSDGVLVGRAVPFSRGREQLAALGRLGRSSQNPGGVLQVRHYAMNHVITPTADGAIGTQYLVVIVPGDGQGKPGSVNQGGRFDDIYAKTAQGWRFKRRTYVPSREGY
jgi:hypothetical protein